MQMGCTVDSREKATCAMMTARARTTHRGYSCPHLTASFPRSPALTRSPCALLQASSSLPLAQMAPYLYFSYTTKPFMVSLRSLDYRATRPLLYSSRDHQPGTLLRPRQFKSRFLLRQIGAIKSPDYCPLMVPTSSCKIDLTPASKPPPPLPPSGTIGSLVGNRSTTTVAQTIEVYGKDSLCVMSNINVRRSAPAAAVALGAAAANGPSQARRPHRAQRDRAKQPYTQQSGGLISLRRSPRCCCAGAAVSPHHLLQRPPEREGVRGQRRRRLQRQRRG